MEGLLACHVFEAAINKHMQEEAKLSNSQLLEGQALGRRPTDLLVLQHCSNTPSWWAALIWT